MLDKLKQKWNSSYGHSIGMVILAMATAINHQVEFSFILFGLSIVLIEIGDIKNMIKDK